MGRLLELAMELETDLGRRAAMGDVVTGAILDRPSGAEARLRSLLDTWASMDESAWPEANVKALHEEIMDIFRDHPEANSWFRAWRAAHPAARLA